MAPQIRDDQSTGAKPQRHYGVWLAIILIAIQVIITIVTYPSLPEQIPSHWNIEGQVDSYTPKLWNAVFLLGLNLLLFTIFLWIVRLGPKINQENQRTMISFVERILPLTVLLILGIQLIQLLIVRGGSVNVPQVITLLLSLLFVYTGNYFGKLRRNFWAGIRTPWTIASDTVWERTHRLGGWLFVAFGILGAILSFMMPPFMLFICFVGGILFVTVIVMVYSYLIYQGLEKSGGEVLSPPFDRDV